MGMNLRTCCHKCREQIFHYRRKENETLLPFYKKHYYCMRENPKNIETLEDQVQEKDWMDDYSSDESLYPVKWTILEEENI